MAIYHLHVRNISRGDGRSAVAAAAYRAGQTLPNEVEERDSAFGGRRDVLHAEIRLPAGAPAWMADRASLWNAVEAAEKRKDARLAKEIEFALPRELVRADWLGLARSMADAYTSLGHVADLAIHDDGSGHNPHVHLLLTTRAITADGFGGKMREADGVKFVTEARARWAEIANVALKKSGSTNSIDARSYKAIGEERTAGTHRKVDTAQRRERRAQMDPTRLEDARAELAATASKKPDDTTERGHPGLPVPDADGNAITPAEQDRAEMAMIAEMEAPADQYPQPPSPVEFQDDVREVQAARAAGDHQALTDWWRQKAEGDEREPAERRAPVPNQGPAWWREGAQDEREAPDWSEARDRQR